jgi:hypothetical protein
MDKWLITVHAWGSVIFVGTEEEAETFLEHKTEWEGSAGLMRPATPDDLTKHRFTLSMEK